MADVGFAIECKSTDKPWVLFMSENKRLHPHARVTQRAFSESAREALAGLVPEVEALPVFSMPRRPGYGVTCAFTTGRDDAFAAIQSVSKSAAALARRLEGQRERVASIKRLVFPVVVIKGSLLECSLIRDTDDVELRQVESSVLVWRNPVVSIHIVSEAGLTRFCRDAAASARPLAAALANHKNSGEGEGENT